MMDWLKNFYQELLEFFSDEEKPEEPQFDAAHVAAVIVGSIVALGAIFWILWTILVYEGGLFGKIGPALHVLFTSKTLQDYGWVGYPYDCGVFQGFLPNIIAFVILLFLMWGVAWVFQQRAEPDTSEENSREI